MNSQELELNDRVRVILGSGLMVLSSLFAVFIFCDRMDMRPFEFPTVWYSTRSLHLLLCGAMFFCAAKMLRSPPHRTQNRAQPLFSSCRLFTRKHCPLCDDAIAVLAGFQGALPGIEMIDIDDSRELMRQFGESVPVVEIEGKVRFRGGVNAHLLQRLINAAERRAEVAGLDARARGHETADSAA
jgi:glutaredoxin